MKKFNKKYVIIISILVFIFIIIPLSYIFIYNIVTKPSGEENVTTKLSIETDFLNWFIDFNKLYNQKIKTPEYSLTKDAFLKVNNLLDSNIEDDIYFKDNIYYIEDDITLELDVNTRSFRYTKYEDEKIIEILEVRLLNGKYYVQLVDEKYIYKISFNKKMEKNKKIKNKQSDVKIEESIFKVENFNW